MQLLTHRQLIIVGFTGFKVKGTQSCPVLWDPITVQSRNSPGQNTGVGSLSLLQGLFPTQGSSSGLPHCRWILYQLTHQGSPWLPELLITLARVCLTVCTCMSPRQCACVGMCVYSKHNLEIRLALHIYSNQVTNIGLHHKDLYPIRNDLYKLHETEFILPFQYVHTEATLLTRLIDPGGSLKQNQYKYKYG